MNGRQLALGHDRKQEHTDVSATALKNNDE
jgi:hypothetical protein